jgi:hypothetical protein
MDPIPAVGNRAADQAGKGVDLGPNSAPSKTRWVLPAPSGKFSSSPPSMREISLSEQESFGAPKGVLRSEAEPHLRAALGAKGDPSLS